MASGRSLGGGRVLGTGRSLASAQSQQQATKAPIPRSTGLLSPSESSLSLNSQSTNTPISADNEDLTSRVALDSHGPGQGAAAASAAMVCPICSEQMVTLLQLNRHIDDNHANLEVMEQEEAKNWFESQMKKAKKFQPLQILNQKFRGMEVFESNNDVPRPFASATSTPPRNDSRGASPAPAPPATISPPDPEDIITRSHWQRPTGNDPCSDPMCRKRLGAANGQVNCRHCGKLFCDEHTMYQMKLSRSAAHEPVRGMWYRVCETCYKTREGYNDHNGSQRNHFDYFKAARRKVVDKNYLETSRLETRLTRLTQLLAEPPPPPPIESKRLSIWSTIGSTISSTIAGDRDYIRTLEQSVVSWEDDALILACPFCQQPFSQYALRRHHCRTCGRVVCGDPNTACSSTIALDVDRSTSKEKAPSKTAVDVRMCKDCQRTIFSKADFARETASTPPDLLTFHRLKDFEQGIRLLLPKFQRLLLALQDPEKPPTPAQLADAGRVRKRLTETFNLYNTAARRIRDLPSDSPTQLRLQKAVYSEAMTFLHMHMLPLKSMPKLKHATPHGRPQSALSNVQYNDIVAANGGRPDSHASSVSSVAIAAIESEEKELRDRLIVLEEQKFMVSEMMADANKRRKFDEAAALARNVDDLGREITEIQGKLGKMDFAAVYIGGLNGVAR